MKFGKELFYLNRVTHLYSTMFMSSLYFISYFESGDFNSTPWGLNQSYIDTMSALILITGIVYAYFTRVIINIIILI
jgi:hypothetical protein